MVVKRSTGADADSWSLGGYANDVTM